MGGYFLFLLPVKSNGRIRLHESQIDLVPQQFSNVADLVSNHGRPLQTQPPSMHSHVLRQPHSLQHLRTELARVSNLDPLAQTLVVSEDLH